MQFDRWKMFSSIPDMRRRRKTFGFSLFFSDFMLKGKTQKSQTYVKHKRCAHPLRWWTNIHMLLSHRLPAPATTWVTLHRRELFFPLIRSFQNHTSFLLKVSPFSLSVETESFSSPYFSFRSRGKAQTEKWWKSFSVYKQSAPGGKEERAEGFLCFYLSTKFEKLWENNIRKFFWRKFPIFKFPNLRTRLRKNENNLFPFTSTL